jgi:hypothetical protein
MDEPSRHLERRKNTLLWLGMLGPAVVWLIYLEATYLLVHHARQTGSLMPLHIVSAVFLICSLAGGIVAWSQWRSLSTATAALDENTVARKRFMSFLGMAASLEFSLLILASWIAIFILNPWQSG